jgi:hypothetical protein
VNKMRKLAAAMGAAARQVVENEADKLGIPKDSPLRQCAPITLTACGITKRFGGKKGKRSK